MWGRNIQFGFINIFSITWLLGMVDIYVCNVFINNIHIHIMADQLNLTVWISPIMN